MVIYNIAGVKEALSRRKDAAAKEAFSEIVKAENMFLDALAEKGLRFESGKIVGARNEEEENSEVKKSGKSRSDEKSVRDTVDNGGEKEYNRKAITPSKTSDGYYLVEVNPYRSSTNTKIVLTDESPEKLGNYTHCTSPFVR